MKITVRNYQKKIPINPIRIKKTILRILSSERVKQSGEITVCFVSDAKIKELNLRYSGSNIATDVLAFDLTDPIKRDYLLGDIIISSDTAISNAARFKTTPRFELELYLVHGMLHLLGYNDKNMKQERLMRKKEREYVN